MSARKCLSATLLSAFVGLVAFVPNATAEPTTISTPGFSVTFPSKWRVETNRNGTILAGIKGEGPPFVIIYYADNPATDASAENTDHFSRLKQQSIADVMGEQGKKMIAESRWHHSETIVRPGGIKEERLDLEAINGQCALVRFFHNAPNAELYFALLPEVPCEQAKSEFEGLINSIKWK